MTMTVDRYRDLLRAAGHPEREVSRAVLYVATYGFEALDAPGCSVYRTPTCGDWECISPEHQDLGESITPEQEAARDAGLPADAWQPPINRAQRRARKRGRH